MPNLSDRIEPPFNPRCDYRHDDGTDPLADWALIGESGDYYVCDWHFQQRTDEGKRGWSRVAHAE